MNKFHVTVSGGGIFNGSLLTYITIIIILKNKFSEQHLEVNVHEDRK